MRESKFKSYDDLPLTLTAPEVGEVLGISRAAAYELVRRTQIYPAVMSVGYICGPRISSYMFAGGIFSWMVMIPLIVLFGEQLILYPGTETIGAIFGRKGKKMGSRLRK